MQCAVLVRESRVYVTVTRTTENGMQWRVLSGQVPETGDVLATPLAMATGVM